MSSHNLRPTIHCAHRLSQLSIAIAALLGATSGTAGVSVSTSPLLTATGVAPNVLFVLDDSGSMQWEVMPDSLMTPPGSTTTNNGYGYLFPLPLQNGATVATYGSADYGDNMPDFDDNTPNNVRLRSPQVNAVFYNPQVDYDPWVTYNGTATVPYYGSGNVLPTAAPFNPALAGAGTLDLTVQQTKRARWYGSATCSADNGTRTNCSFWPVTFYIYTGTGDPKTAALSQFKRYQIRSGVAYEKNLATGAETTLTQFAWGSKTRTVAEELQNFANWFSYYRSRMLSAKGGASLAFADLGEKFRVGITTINGPGGTTNTIATPTTGGFNSSGRAAWFNKLLGYPVPAQGTPLRSALKWAGDYYSATKTIGGVAGYDPWVPSGEAECRQSFTILTTDGYWSDETISIGSRDANDGPVHLNDLGGTSFGYKAEFPYSDSVTTVTLADIANYYWKNDLRTSVKNKVTSTDDPAYWQHMTTFTLSFGVEGTLDQDAGFPASWPDPATLEARKIDDLWHAAINGHGKFVSAKDPDAFRKGLNDALSKIGEQAASAASLSGNSTSVQSGSTVFQGKYVGGKWSGDLVAWSLASNGAVIPSPKWSASAQLPKASERNIFTRIGGVPKAFVASDSTVVAAVGTADEVNYIRGDQSKEGSVVGSLRTRTSLIGDIVNSSPAYAGPPPNRVWERTKIAGASSYKKFRSDFAKRTPMVYVGANDGMLHAFDANTGKEMFAYIPAALLSRVRNLAKQDYAHEFFVDGNVVVEDVFDGSKWRTILVAALGRGGKTVFAMDVTNPVSSNGTLTFNPASDLLWEITDADLGNVLGVPAITPLNNGSWGVVLGNGYNGASDKAYLYVIDAVTGSIIKKIGTDAKTSNGLSGVGGWDEDGDGDADYLYSGDLFGQLWKFDVTASNTNSWKTATTGPMFVAKDPSANPQPITAPPIVGSHPDTGERWVFFGTGRFISDSDRTNTSIQTWYGLRDVETISGRTELVERIITKEGNNGKGYFRLISDQGDASGGAKLQDSAGNYVKQGWYIDLLVGGSTAPRTGERMLVRNTLLKDVLLGETLIPNNTACGSLGDGWLLAVNPWIGGRPKDDFFDTNVDGTVNKGDHIEDKTASGWKLGNGGIPYIQECEGELCMTTTSTDGDKAPETVKGDDGTVRGRLTWREILRD